MKYAHPEITITSPIAGHYLITGHKPRPVFVPDQGHVVPPGECYISPEIPDSALQAILDDRAAQRGGAVSAPAIGAVAQVVTGAARAPRKRRTKAEIKAEKDAAKAAETARIAAEEAARAAAEEGEA